MNSLPRQLIAAKKLAEALNEKRKPLSAAIENVDVEVSIVDREMGRTHKAIYEVFAEGLSGSMSGIWLMSYQNIDMVSFFCDDGLNVRAFELVDTTNTATPGAAQDQEEAKILNSMVLIAVEEVLKDNGY